MTEKPDLRLPRNFRFGAATAAYQIEGATQTDGRGASIWDAFSAQPGKVVGGDTGERACEHYQRWESDLDLAASLGLDSYRFSIAWPRVLPAGRGSVERRGLAFYDRLIDGCLQRGLQPFATLYHWDLPLALEKAGGWRSRETAAAFGEYAAVVAARFGDRLHTLCTFNEPWCSAVLGHLSGVHAPGHTDLDETLAVIHHQHVAHGLAVRAIRAETATPALGIVLNAQAVYPGSDDEADVAAAVRHEAFHNGLWFSPLFGEGYPPEALEALGARLPEGFQDDMAGIREPLDWWGLNYYTPARVRHDEGAAWPSSAVVAPAGGVPVTDIGWEIAPATLTDCLTRLNERWSLPPCWITENGCCDNTGIVDGAIDDTMRRDYLHAHLDALADAIDAGVDVRGYFAWSLMDNFEWAEGFAMRFGIVHVDYDTQVRTIKLSGHAYAELIAAYRDRR